MATENARVLAVSKSPTHTFGKPRQSEIRLLAGLGVEGDAHMGETVKHRSRVAADPTKPNLRQVHLVQAELLDELHEKGFAVEPGEMGENITTQGVNLLDLSRGTLLRLGREAVIEVTPAQPMQAARRLSARPHAGRARPGRHGAARAQVRRHGHRAHERGRAARRPDSGRTLAHAARQAGARVGGR
jgi:hypothetical protein